MKSEKNNKGGSFTVRSRSTGKDFTYRIARSEFKNRWYTQVYIETQYLQFRHLGVYKDHAIFKKGQKVVTPAAQGIAWILNNIQAGKIKAIETQAEILHLGSCIKCGKTLTDATSISIGLGPHCRAY